MQRISDIYARYQIVIYILESLRKYRVPFGHTLVSLGVHFSCFNALHQKYVCFQKSAMVQLQPLEYWVFDTLTCIILLTLTYTLYVIPVTNTYCTIFWKWFNVNWENAPFSHNRNMPDFTVLIILIRKTI